jgi:ATP/maltotriose-dependent transcriptional regulator MalT
MGPRLEIPLYREWINAIFERISVPIQIVLDGLDRLSSEALSFQFIQVLVEDVPNHIHLMMLSREELPFEVQALKMRQEALVLTNEELAFTQDEVKEFFREGRGISFTLGELRRIHQFTEGWIGGMILLAETLDRLPDESRKKYIGSKERCFNILARRFFLLNPLLFKNSLSNLLFLILLNRIL